MLPPKSFFIMTLSSKNLRAPKKKLGPLHAGCPRAGLALQLPFAAAWTPSSECREPFFVLREQEEQRDDCDETADEGVERIKCHTILYG